MSDRRVAVVGSLHYDITLDSPSLPRRGETVAGQSWQPKFGGKGRNQAVAASRAGAPTAMIGVVGPDSWGRELRADLEARGIDCRFLRTDAATPSGMSVAIFEADGDYGAVIVSGANLALGPADIDAAGAVLASARVLVLQNEVTEAANLAAAAAVPADALVILNAAPARAIPAGLRDRVDLLVVNAVEAHALGGGEEPSTLDAATSVARRLAADCRSVLVTVGAAGAALSGRLGDHALPAVPVTVASTHGAGDEYVGALAAALARGEQVPAAMQVAGRAAAALVATPEAARR